MTKKMNNKQVTKNELVSLFMLIRDTKSNNLSREAMIKYIPLRMKLKALFDEYEKVRNEISEQTKPADWKEGDPQDVWNEAFKPVMEAWLNEPADINTHIFTEEECIDYIISNPDKNGMFADIITEYFKV